MAKPSSRIGDNNYYKGKENINLSRPPVATNEIQEHDKIIINQEICQFLFDNEKNTYGILINQIKFLCERFIKTEDRRIKKEGKYTFENNVINKNIYTEVESINILLKKDKNPDYDKNGISENKPHIYTIKIDKIYKDGKIDNLELKQKGPNKNPQNAMKYILEKNIAKISYKKSIKQKIIDFAKKIFGCIE